MLMDPLDTILGTRTKVRLLRSLIDLTRSVSGREAARLAGVSPIAQQAIDELAQVGILDLQPTPAANLYSVNRNHRLSAALVALFEAERARYSAIIQAIQDVLASEEGAISAALFGSAARGAEEPGSDLDLLVVLEEAVHKSDISEALLDLSGSLAEEFGVSLSPVLLTRAELESQSGDPRSFAARALSESRTVFGQPLEELRNGQET